MKFLDTSFLVDYLRGKDYTLELLEKNEDEALYTSTVSLFELFRGELKTGKDNSIENLKNNLEWLNEKKLGRREVENAARIEKELSDKGKKINLADVLIAGTVQETGATLVTVDSDFEEIEDIEVMNPQKTNSSAQ